MPLNIGFHISHLTDGSDLEVRQDSCQRDMAVDPSIWVISLSVIRTLGKSSTTLRGTITVPEETLTELPGESDGEKSRAVEQALATWFGARGLNADFDLGAVVDKQTGVRLISL